MKKLLSLAIVAVGLVANAETISTTIQPGQMTNVLALRNGTATISQILLTANTTNTTVRFYDNTTNLTYKIVPAYTNNFSYATNLISSYTNYFGVVNTYTNLVLVDVTNNVVPAYTNCTSTVDMSALASTTATANGYYYFHQGVWVTNTSSGTAQLTLTFRQ